MQTLTLLPTAFWLEQINISYKLDMTREKKTNQKIPNKMALTYGEGFMPRIYLNTPLLKFGKTGENEGVKYGNFYKQVFIEQPYWFHITLNSDEDLFLRSARREWRKVNDRYETILKYIEEVHLRRYYNNMSFEEAKEYYIDKVIKPDLVKYNEKRYFKYPEKLQRIINND
jgi:hypothetical protein